MSDEFYVRYYVGHKGKFGHEFLEFEFRPDGRLRYANNSQYKTGPNPYNTMIRKEGASSGSHMAAMQWPKSHALCAEASPSRCAPWQCL